MRCGGGDHQRAGFNLIRNDGVRAAALQRIHAANADDIRTRAFDAAAHRIEKVGQIDDVRFLGGIVNRGDALCAGGRQHDVDRAADRDHIHKHV